eukprot:CAMPEP_0184091848 /NCGR_PEP_ID=MMETSP0974-20121125/7945_1 /TAXON_ID=483370 /ORGANISM="non described non described, Strain CCMP2097" /LENGTH=136 /DNA_ID=CAMNT_0026394591 /DNA_START=125 /DNA_END=531 /DNA_ORIENTATION=+
MVAVVGGRAVFLGPDEAAPTGMHATPRYCVEGTPEGTAEEEAAPSRRVLGLQRSGLDDADHHDDRDHETQPPVPSGRLRRRATRGDATAPHQPARKRRRLHAGLQRLGLPRAGCGCWSSSKFPPGQFQAPPSFLRT